MIVLLPPSETKSAGGDGPPLALEALSWPALRGVRERLVAALVQLAADPAASRVALGLGPRADAEVAANAALRSAPTTPVLDRYRGVLYDALAPATLSPAARARAERDVVVTSALFGAVRGGDRVPAYRLSAGSRLPGIGPLAGLWRPLLAGVLADLTAEQDRPVLDLRSGAYVALWGRPPVGARPLPVRVLAEAADGTRSVVSHANKAAKGRLARALLEQEAPAGAGVELVVDAARRAGLVAEVSAGGIDLVEPRRPAQRSASAGSRSRTTTAASDA